PSRNRRRRECALRRNPAPSGEQGPGAEPGVAGRESGDPSTGNRDGGSMGRGEELTPEAFSAQRQRMVEFQVRRRGVADERVLEAMERVPRHLFVPPAARESAYDDRPLPIGGGQTISQPYVVARMAELAEIGPHDSVLEVGAGSGYAAAVFAELADRVTTVEIRPELAAMARENLDRAGYSRVEVVAGGPEAVDPERRFDAILVAAAAREIPPD